jgi:hypothetical protein
MKLYLKLFSLTVILMYCLSPLVATDFNDTNFNGLIEENSNNLSDIDGINNTLIEENEINETTQDSIDDENNAAFNVYVDPCSCGDDLQVHIDSDYEHPMNVSFVLYNAVGYPIYTAHNIDISSHGSAVIPAKILFYCGEYKIKAIFECKNYTVERTVTFNVD